MFFTDRKTFTPPRAIDTHVTARRFDVADDWTRVTPGDRVRVTRNPDRLFRGVLPDEFEGTVNTHARGYAGTPMLYVTPAKPQLGWPSVIGFAWSTARVTRL